MKYNYNTPKEITIQLQRLYNEYFKDYRNTKGSWVEFDSTQHKDDLGNKYIYFHLKDYGKKESLWNKGSDYIRDIVIKKFKGTVCTLKTDRKMLLFIPKNIGVEPELR